MLRRRRLSVLVSAVLFLFAGTAEAAGVHRCPHHDVLPGAAAAEAVHHGHDAAHDDTSAPAPHGECSCMGACQPGGAATTADPGATAIAVDATAHAPAGWWSPTAPRAALVPFALPFANAPPAR